MGTGVSAPEALVLICSRNDLFCYDRIGRRRGCVSGMSGVCLWREFTFQRFKSATQPDEIKTPPSSNFRGRTVGPICQVFSWTDVPRMRLQLKILFGSSSHSQEKSKNLLGGGGGGGNTQLNLLVSAAENCEFMIHTLSAAISISGSVQYQLRMNLILSNFEMSNEIGYIVKVQLNEKKFKPVIE